MKNLIKRIAMPRVLMLAGFILAGLAGCERPIPEKTSQTEANLKISDAHMPEPPPGVSMGAIYLVLENSQSRDRQLLMLETDVASSAQLHRTSYDDGAMRMRHVPHLTLPAGQTIRFEPGGYHVMLMQLDGSLPSGTQFELRLTFDGGEVISTDVEVRKRQ